MTGMRRLALALAALAACASEPAPPPSDGGPPNDERLVRYCRERGTFCAPEGATCDRAGWCDENGCSPFCNQGFSWCSSETERCVAFCDPNSTHEPCANGKTARYEPDDSGSMVCTCQH